MLAQFKQVEAFVDRALILMIELCAEQDENGQGLERLDEEFSEICSKILRQLLFIKVWLQVDYPASPAMLIPKLLAKFNGLELLLAQAEVDTNSLPLQAASFYFDAAIPLLVSSQEAVGRKTNVHWSD